MKPGVPSLHSTRLLDQVRERIRYVHYSLNIVKYYLFGINYFLYSSAHGVGSMRHPAASAFGK